MMTKGEKMSSTSPSTAEAMVSIEPVDPEIVRRCVMAARGWTLRSGIRVLAIEADQGAVSIPLAQALPQCTVIHLDPDPSRCGAAQAKATEFQLTNLEFLPCELHSANFLPASMGAIISLNLLPESLDPEAAAKLLTEWLAPSGWLLCWDAGLRRAADNWLAPLRALWTRRPSPANYCGAFERNGLLVQDDSWFRSADQGYVVFRKAAV